MADRRHLEMNQLENEIGVEQGYFAALQRGDTAAPGADLMLATANRLSVPLDVLLKLELDIDSEDERLLYRYLHKLTNETMVHRISWQEDIFANPYDPLLRDDGTPIHPLYKLPLSEDEEPPEPCYCSFFRPDIGLIPVTVYGCNISETDTLYLVRVWNTGDNPDSPGDWDELELQVVRTESRKNVPLDQPTPSTIIPICHSDHERPSVLNTMLESLFTVVEENAALPRLSDEARELIESYLAEGESESQGSDAEGSHHGAELEE